jgi:hypothetical protein
LLYGESLGEAAQRAERAVKETINAYSDNTIPNEVSINGNLATMLRKELNGTIRGLRWSARDNEERARFGGRRNGNRC